MPKKSYETTVHLPSNGKLYGEGGPEDITIRAITTREEKFLLGSSNNDSIDEIIEACIVKPAGLKMDDLILPDVNYLLYKLRIHTYGAAYDISTICPNCGSTNNNKVNLNDFLVYELDDDFQEPFEVELPMSEDTLTVRLLRKRDYDLVDSRAKKLAKKSRNTTQAEIAYNLRFARYILKINDKDVSWEEAQQYTIDMHGRDSAWFWHVVNDIQVGYDTDVDIICDNCGHEYTSPLPMTMDFFRPSFE